MNTTATADTIDLGKDDYRESHDHKDDHKHGHRHGHKHGGCAHKGRRKWSGLEIFTMVGGFIVYWPVGLVALGVKIVTGEMWPGSKENVMPWTAYSNWRAAKGSKPFGFTAPNWSASGWNHASSGNAAFDAYKKEQLDRLEAERRKLDEEQKAFAEHLAKLREAKDKEEFDRFMAERAAPKAE